MECDTAVLDKVKPAVSTKILHKEKKFTIFVELKLKHKFLGIATWEVNVMEE